jgi:hypothetical protein
MSEDAPVRALPNDLDALRARHLSRRAAGAEHLAETTAVDDETGQVVKGSVLPRLYTPPLVELTPDTSYGYDLIEFARAIGWPLRPWQEWLAVHMGELLPDGRPRFRMVLVLVARQNGKTTFVRILILYWMLVEMVPLIVGTSTGRDTAKRSWREVINAAQGNDLIKHRFGRPRESISEEDFFTIACSSTCTVDHEHRRRSSYRFAAPTRRAGRGDTVHRAALDELREHDTFDVYDALVKAMTAVADGQAVAITNQGDLTAIVLDSLRTSAIEYIETGQGDPRLFLAEWSAPSGSDPTDPRAIAQANPSLGDGILLDSIIGEAIRAKKKGGVELTGYKTETLCMRVPMLDPAIDPDSFRACGMPRADFPNLADHRRDVAVVLDVSLDATHATLHAAAVIDGMVYGEPVKAWQGPDCTRRVRAELPALLEKLRPGVFGWFPDGPAAVIAADLRKRRGVRIVPRGTRAEEIRGEVAAVCMGFADLIKTDGYRHTRDPLVVAHVGRTEKLTRGDVWTFTRNGTEPVDATYAAAGSAHLARVRPRGRGALAAVPDRPPHGDDDGRQDRS